MLLTDCLGGKSSTIDIITENKAVFEEPNIAQVMGTLLGKLRREISVPVPTQAGAELCPGLNTRHLEKRCCVQAENWWKLEVFVAAPDTLHSFCWCDGAGGVCVENEGRQKRRMGGCCVYLDGDVTSPASTDTGCCLNA